jgi:hypothetical protein
MATKKKPAIFTPGQAVPDSADVTDAIIALDLAKVEEKVVANDPELVDLADMADAYWNLREQRLKIKKEVDDLELKEKMLSVRILERMEKLRLTAIGGSVVTLTLKTTYEPTVENWPSFYEYIQQSGEFDLLYRRLNPAAVKQRWEADKPVPGVTKFPVTKLAKSGVK